MRFKTLEEYNKKLEIMERDLNEMEKYLEKHPESIGTKGNYESYLYVYEVFKNDKKTFINQANIIDLIITSDMTNTGLSVSNLSKLSDTFNKTQNIATTLFNGDPNNEDLLVKRISEGSYKITFAFQNPTEDDVTRKSPRKKGLLKIFDFINCKDNIEKLKKEAGHNGYEALLSYRKFLKEIVAQNADFTLDTEMGTVKSTLTVEQSKYICENLDI